MRTVYRIETDEWTTDGSNIIDPEKLETIRQTLEQSSIIVEHWFYYGSRAPDRFIFDDYDEFVEYLETHAKAGDAVRVWSFGAICREDNELVSGKCPDDDGLVPRKGAY